MLSPDEKARYGRQMMIEGWGEAGQEKLKKACVLVAGAGGLGSPAALYLCAAGAGKIRLVDPDVVESANLNRQILHWSNDTGKAKIESAAEKLHQLNNGVILDTLRIKINQDNIDEMVSGCDIILDCLDNLSTRYLLNQAAIKHGIPLVHAAVNSFEGRVMTVLPGKTACLMCLYRGAVSDEPSAIAGMTAGAVACLQVNEAIKYITGLGELLTGKMLVYEGLNNRHTVIDVQRDPECPHCKGIGPDI